MYIYRLDTHGHTHRCTWYLDERPATTRAQLLARAGAQRATVTAVRLPWILRPLRGPLLRFLNGEANLAHA